MSPNSADNWEFTEFVFRHILFSMVFLLGKEGNGGQLHMRDAWYAEVRDRDGRVPCASIGRWCHCKKPDNESMMPLAYKL